MLQGILALLVLLWLVLLWLTKYQGRKLEQTDGETCGACCGLQGSRGLPSKGLQGACVPDLLQGLEGPRAPEAPFGTPVALQGAPGDPSAPGAPVAGAPVAAQVPGVRKASEIVSLTGF